MVAAEIAPEVDRLVLSISRSVGPRHRDRLGALARQCGLDSLELLPHYEDFLFAGTLTREIAVLRSRYRAPERVLARLDELEQKQLITTAGGGLVATPRLRPLLEALLETRAEIATELWGRHRPDVVLAAAVAGEVAATASDDHVVAVRHRALPEPANPFLLLEHRLLTLRFMRQHDHAAAWSARGLTAPEMVVLTGLWQGHATGDAGDGLGALAARGYAAGDPPALTAAGREAREEIERETNRRVGGTFAMLGDDRAAEFLAALRRLPGEEMP